MSIDANYPINNYFLGMVSTITFKKLLGLVGASFNSKTFTAAANKLPHQITDAGIYPIQEHCSRAQLDDPAGNPNCFVRISVSPGKQQTVKTSTNSIIVPSGYAFAGKAKMFGYGASLVSLIDPSTLTYQTKATLDPLNIAGGMLTMTKSQSNTHEGPMMVIDVSPTTGALVNIKGHAGIDFLDLSTEANVVVSSNGAEFQSRFCLLGVIDAKVDIGWGWNLAQPRLNFRAQADVDMEKLASRVRELIMGDKEGKEASRDLLQHAKQRPRRRRTPRRAWENYSDRH